MNTTIINRDVSPEDHIESTGTLAELIDMIAALAYNDIQLPTDVVINQIEDLVGGYQYSQTNPEFDDWLRHIGDLHDRKNRGYAGAVDNDPLHNFRQSEIFNVPVHVGIAVRLSDKFSRFYSLLRNPDNDLVSESLLDVADDMGVYSGLFKIGYRHHLAKRP